MTEIEFVVISSSDSEQQSITERITRRKKKPASNAFMQDYCLKHRRAYACEHCKRIYTCKSSLTKHQGRSIKCYMERVEAVFEEIKQTPAKQIKPKGSIRQDGRHNTNELVAFLIISLKPELT